MLSDVILDVAEANARNGYATEPGIVAELCAELRRLRSEDRQQQCVADAAGRSPPLPTLEDFWIVVTQYDTNPNTPSLGGPPAGPLVHEGFLLSEQDARQRAAGLAGRYGWAAYMRVTKSASTP